MRSPAHWYPGTPALGNIAKEIFIRKVASRFCKRHGLFAQRLKLNEPQMAGKGFTYCVIYLIGDWLCRASALVLYPVE
jgi:hypothetical protein